MSLVPGTRLGQYEILSPLGAGGMGEVYRARDTTLQRDVAIKILPDAFASDPERLARFEREATTLASLNHPHIAQIYGVTGDAATRGLVMELVEGETLADRIQRGPVPLNEALAIARQLAGALDAAHERGIVHRDLKPANLKVTPEATVKVLDFGLAKTLSPPAGSASQASASLANSPTLASPALMTHRGVILGTAGYMSPEQATGRPVDKRTDIWAFGVVLYEMLTATHLFAAETLSDTLAAVLRAEIDWSRLPPTTPPHIRRLVELCLTRDVRRRLRDIGDARLELEQPVVAPQAPPRRISVWLGWSVAAVLALLLVTLALRARSSEGPGPGFALAIVPPSGSALVTEGSGHSKPEISPDGTAVLFATTTGYYVRRLDDMAAVRVPGSETARGAAFWSPDSASVAFPTPALVRVRLPSGPPQVIAAGSPNPTRGGTWSRSNMILLSTSAGGAEGALLLVPAAGGETKLLTVPGVSAMNYYYPEFVAGTDDFLFLVDREDGSPREVYLATIRDGEIVNPVSLLKNETPARYTPAAGGRLLFVQNDNLYAQRLNLQKRALEGDADLIATGVVSQPGNTSPHGDFSVSTTGIVAWRSGQAALSQVMAWDRNGTALGTVGPALSIGSIVLAPDDTRLLAAGSDGAWVLDVEQAGRRMLPRGIDWRDWSSDALKVLGMNREMALLELGAGDLTEPRPIGGSVGPKGYGAFSVAPDQTAVLIMQPGSAAAFWAQTRGSVGDRTLKRLSVAGERTFHHRFSPDGRWIVYVTAVPDSQGATGDVFVQPFPGTGRPRRIATEGSQPEWRRDGQEIVYLDAKGVASVAVTGVGDDLRFDSPRHLFSVTFRAPGGPPFAARLLAVSRDGSRFYYPQRIEQPEAGVIHVKTQWTNRSNR